MEKFKLIKLNIITFVFFVTILTFSRILPHAPNFTPFIALIIFCSFVVKDRITLIFVIYLSLLLSDIILGTYEGSYVIYIIQIFIALTVPFILKKLNFINVFYSTIYSSLIFHFFSSPAHIIFIEGKELNLEILIRSYYDDLPFFINTITATFLYSCIFFIFLSKLKIRTKLVKKKNSNLN